MLTPTPMQIAAVSKLLHILKDLPIGQGAVLRINTILRVSETADLNALEQSCGTLSYDYRTTALQENNRSAAADEEEEGENKSHVVLGMVPGAVRATSSYPSQDDLKMQRLEGRFDTETVSNLNSQMRSSRTDE